MDQILQDREKRFEEILAFIEKYKLPVICGKINYPGNNKNTLQAKAAFRVLEQLLTDEFDKNSVCTKITSGADGKSILIPVAMKGVEAKKIAVEIEMNHPLGRIFDIDVYEGDGSSIGRESLGLQSRNCVLCNEDARVCIRTQRHSLEEIVKHIDALIKMLTFQKDRLE